MAQDIPEESKKALCELAKQLSLPDLYCRETPKESSKPADDDKQKRLRPSPFGADRKAPEQAQTEIQKSQPQVPPVKRPNPEPNTQTKKLMPTVYVDIGHCTSQDPQTGKIDEGFNSDSYTECQVNQAVGKNLINELKQSGFRVVSTWNPDSPPFLVPKPEDLERRIKIVNSDIQANKADSIYVSLHHDADPQGMGGQCVYIAQPKMDEARTLAETIQQSAWKVRFREGYPQCIEPDTRTHNGKLVGLRGVNTIGVLIESANVKNAEDKQLMMRPEFHALEARKISQGIKNYFQLKLGSQRPYPSYYQKP